MICRLIENVGKAIIIITASVLFLSVVVGFTMIAWTPILHGKLVADTIVLFFGWLFCFGFTLSVVGAVLKSWIER